MQFGELDADLQAEAWRRLDRSQRAYAAQLGLQPPHGPRGREGKGLFAGAAYAVLCLVVLLALANLWPGPQTAESESRDATDGPVATAPAEAPPSPAAAPPRSEPVAGGSLRVRARGNVRGRPSVQAPVVGKVNPGESLPYLKKEGEWFLLRPSKLQGDRYIHETVVDPPADLSLTSEGF